MTLQQGIDVLEESHRNLGSFHVSHVTVGGRVLDLSFGRSIVHFESVYERLQDEEKSRRVGVVRVLHLKFLGHFAPRFWAENLLSSYPAVFIHEVEPALDNVEPGPRLVGVP